jgi:hypothetical protein
LSRFYALPLAFALVGCFQELNAGAASGSSTAADAGDDAPDTGAVSDAPVPTAIVDGTPMELPDGGMADDPCMVTVDQARQIRETYCAACHAPPAKMGGFDFVLDDAKLKSAVSSTVFDDAGKPLRFLVPGDPDRSRIYHRIVAGEMPPTQAPPLPPNPAPTVSDLSVLRTWITACCGPSEQGD